MKVAEKFMDSISIIRLHVQDLANGGFSCANTQSFTIHNCHQGRTQLLPINNCHYIKHDFFLNLLAVRHEYTNRNENVRSSFERNFARTIQRRKATLRMEVYLPYFLNTKVGS